MRRHHTTIRLILMVVVGLIAAAVTVALGRYALAPTVGWSAAAAFYTAWVWIDIQGQDGEATEEHASREEPARAIDDVLVLLLSVTSLFAVAYLLVRASQLHGLDRGLLAGLALISVALSWLLLHTLYTLRYAQLYYTKGGGVNFNQTDPPRYSDFAYLAFTLGMTFQVSDTNITTHEVRITALRHGLLSFLFGTVILASTVNLVAQLTGS